MITGNFKSVEELDKAYSDHIESVVMSGVEADIDGLRDAWEQARAEFLDS